MDDDDDGATTSSSESSGGADDAAAAAGTTGADVSRVYVVEMEDEQAEDICIALGDRTPPPGIQLVSTDAPVASVCTPRQGPMLLPAEPLQLLDWPRDVAAARAAARAQRPTSQRPASGRGAPAAAAAGLSLPSGRPLAQSMIVVVLRMRWSDLAAVGPGGGVLGSAAQRDADGGAVVAAADAVDGGGAFGASLLTSRVASQQAITSSSSSAGTHGRESASSAEPSSFAHGGPHANSGSGTAGGGSATASWGGAMHSVGSSFVGAARGVSAGIAHALRLATLKGIHSGAPQAADAATDGASAQHGGMAAGGPASPAPESQLRQGYATAAAAAARTARQLLAQRGATSAAGVASAGGGAGPVVVSGGSAAGQPAEWRASSAPLSDSERLARLFHAAYGLLVFKARLHAPCTVCALRTTLSLPEPDVLEVLLTGLILRETGIWLEDAAHPATSRQSTQGGWPDGRSSSSGGYYCGPAAVLLGAPTFPQSGISVYRPPLLLPASIARATVAATLAYASRVRVEGLTLSAWAQGATELQSLQLLHGGSNDRPLTALSAHASPLARTHSESAAATEAAHHGSGLHSSSPLQMSPIPPGAVILDGHDECRG